MREIERSMLNAIRDKRNFKRSNTRVEYDVETNTTTVWSYLSIVAVFDWNTKVLMVYVPSDWPSVTTLSRLRALYEFTQVVFYRKDGIIHVCDNGVKRETTYREILTFPLT